MSGPFDVSPVRARLQLQVPDSRLVGLAADYAAIKALQDFPAPCHYVLLAAEQGEAKPVGHASPGQVVRTRQMVGVAFGVATVVRNYRDSRGEELDAQLREFVGKSRAALIGWVPDLPGARPVQWIRGDLKDYDASTALWVDVYQTQHSIGSAT